MAKKLMARWLWPTLGWMSLALCQALDGWAYEPVAIEFLWQSDPLLEYNWFEPAPVPLIQVTAEKLNATLARERLQVAQSILRVPYSPTLDRATMLAALLQRLEAGEPHRAVRIDLLAATCELDNGEHANQLWKLAQGDEDAQVVVQKACIRWRSSAPIQYWRKCLAALTSSEQDLLYAIDGLGAVESETELQTLEALVMDATRSSAVRLSSARAIGNISDKDQLALAKKISESSADYAQLLAIEVLAKSPVADSRDFVKEIALRGHPLAQRAAYRWLCSRDSSTAQSLVGDFLNHADPDIRAMALNQVMLLDNAQTIAALFEAFGDANPKVRDAARLHVLTCCSKSDERLQTTKTLLQVSIDSDDWRRLEQSIRLTVELKQSQHCDRLLSLVQHARPEVCIPASWALRHLAEEPAILERMLVQVKKVTANLQGASDEVVTEAHLQSTAHLFEAFGLRKFEPAKETALKYVPKNFRMGMITRMTAIWTCGKLWERGENKSLINQLHERIADKASMVPEASSVRFAATLALGWIADADSREPLITNDEPIPYAIGYATQWALKRIDNR